VPGLQIEAGGGSIYAATAVGSFFSFSNSQFFNNALQIFPNATGTTSVKFVDAVTSCQILQLTQTVDAAAAPMGITAQTAWASATTNTTGGNLTLSGGNAKDGTGGGSLILTGGVNGGTNGVIQPMVPFIQWQNTIATPTITQQIQAGDVATHALTIQAGSAFAGATTNINGAFVVVRGGHAKSDGVTGLVGGVDLQTADAQMLRVGQVIVGQHFIALFRGVNATDLPSGSGDNVLYFGRSSSLPTVAPANGLTMYAFDAGGGQSSLGIWADNLVWNKNQPTPGILHDTPTTDIATTLFTLQAQSAWASATTNVTGGDMQIGAGNAKDATLGATLLMKGGTNGGGASIPGAIRVTATSFQWNLSVLNPGLNQDAKTTDVAPSNFVIAAQGAWTSASTNTTGGNLVLRSGAGQSGSGSAQITLVGGTPTTAPMGQISIRVGGGTSTTAGIGGTNADPTGGHFPWAWTSTPVSATSGTVTLSPSTAPQSAAPLIVWTATITAACTLVFPNQPGFWIVDLSGVTGQSATNTISFQSGSNTKVVVNTAAALNTADSLVIVITRGSNTISILGSTATAI
jgi:hypothetical protein